MSSGIFYRSFSKSYLFQKSPLFGACSKEELMEYIIDYNGIYARDIPAPQKFAIKVVKRAIFSSYFRSSIASERKSMGFLVSILRAHPRILFLEHTQGLASLKMVYYHNFWRGTARFSVGLTHEDITNEINETLLGDLNTVLVVRRLYMIGQEIVVEYFGGDAVAMGLASKIRQAVIDNFLLLN